MPPTHPHILRALLQQLLRRTVWTHSQHVVHMHTHADIADNANEHCSFNFLVWCSCLPRGDVRTPGSAFRTFHTNPSPVQKMFRLPSFRWLSKELLSVSHVCSLPRTLRILCLSCRRILPTPFAILDGGRGCVMFSVASHCPLAFPHLGVFIVSTHRPDMPRVPDGTSSPYTSSQSSCSLRACSLVVTVMSS